MKIVEELKTFTNDACDLALRMTAVAEKITHENSMDSSAKLDNMAREMASIAGTIKDLSYRLKTSEANS